MAFDSGSMTFQRFSVVGDVPSTPTEELLGKLASQRLQPTDLGVPEDSEWGWCGPRHILDGSIDFETCVFNDCVHVGLRIDTNKPPAAVIQAYTHAEEQAAAANNPSGFISKLQKRECKDAVTRKLEDELRSGKHRRSKMLPILWDVPAGVVYGPTGVAAADRLRDLFGRTFDGLELWPQTSGRVGGDELDRRVYEDLTPTRFAKSREDPDTPAAYPWTAKGDGAKDFLGNEFLLWLWHATLRQGWIHNTVDGTITVLFDRTLQLDCVFGQSGKDTIAATGPTASPESIEALRTGKVPRRAGLIVDCPAGQFDLTLTGESLAVSSLKLPEIEKADTARTLFEERITLLRDACGVIDRLYGQFLLARGADWMRHADAIARWIKAGRA